MRTRDVATRLGTLRTKGVARVDTFRRRPEGSAIPTPRHRQGQVHSSLVHVLPPSPRSLIRPSPVPATSASRWFARL